MEFNKKSSHNHKKYISGCSDCWQTYYICQKCQGLCIFSQATFKKNSKHPKEFRLRLKNNYYAEDFSRIRSYLLDHETVKDNEEEQENIENLNEYELLKMVHTNFEEYGDAFGKQHVTEYGTWRRKNMGMFLPTSTVKGKCRYDRCVRDKLQYGYKSISRKAKNGTLMRGAKDFILIEN